MTKPHKINVSYRLTDEEKELVEFLARQLGISETDVIKLGIRKVAREEGFNRNTETCSTSDVVQQ